MGDGIPNVWMQSVARVGRQRCRKVASLPAPRRLCVAAGVGFLVLAAGVDPLTFHVASIAGLAVLLLVGWIVYAIGRDVWSAGSRLATRSAHLPHHATPASIRRTVHSPSTEHE